MKSCSSKDLRSLDPFEWYKSQERSGVRPDRISQRDDVGGDAKVEHVIVCSLSGKGRAAHVERRN